uniref:RING-type E3 ubiquitin transferase n=1 Tax=Timema douglasi TaxID=61478 RepID=A0A7R8ZBN5_TIMDO|nr:unnamed protein product [Timema douglasi]
MASLVVHSCCSVCDVIIDFVDEIVDCFVSLGEIRPRARTVLQFEDLHVGDKVMVNYNEEDPKARGHWYDLTVQHLDIVKKKKVVSGTLHFTRESYLNNITITFSDEIMRIEVNKLREEMTEEEKELMHTHIDFRPRAPICSKCCDHPRRRCRACSCYLCGGKDDPEKQILCDECDQAYHLGCLDPPLVNLPEMDEWYCPECKNDENEIVRAGGKLKESKRKSMAASKTTSSKRDWGKGMACVGRTKVCTIVPPDHFGPVPGVEVGTSWLFRMQAQQEREGLKDLQKDRDTLYYTILCGIEMKGGGVACQGQLFMSISLSVVSNQRVEITGASEAGIHRPHVAGIHGREDRGAFSIVLSGGYEDDVDNGDEFWYTGSGGRDLSGNKRTAAQSSDQKLTRMNRALALNCNAPINEQKGSESKDWKKGKPVRVIRSSKLAKHSTYAPSKGNRYDGIYKVVKYYPEKGKAGFIVWRYVLRRDDPTFAPWTKEGKERINRLGLKLEYPENYLEAMASKEKTEGKKTPKAIESHKRKRLSSRNSEENIEVHEGKKVRPEPHTLEKDLAKLIDQDINTKLWGECKKHLIEGTQQFTIFSVLHNQSNLRVLRLLIQNHYHKDSR